MYLMQAQAVIQCNKCHKTYIDPFERGPWEEGVIDTQGEEVVSSYTVELEPSDIDVTLNTTMAEFLRFYYKDAKERVIKEG